MFHPRSPFVGPISVEVTERRAPTDESIRLAEEFRQKALASVLEARPLPGNVLGEIVFLGRAETTVYVLQFMLNGRRYSTEIDETELASAPERVAEIVGRHFVQSLLSK